MAISDIVCTLVHITTSIPAGIIPMVQCYNYTLHAWISDLIPADIYQDYEIIENWEVKGKKSLPLLGPFGSLSEFLSVRVSVSPWDLDIVI